MVAIELVIVLLVAALMLFLNYLPRGYLISSIVLLVMFLFQAANLDARQGNFYSIMALGVLIFAILKMGAKDVESATVAGQKFGGWKYSLLVVAVAVGLFMMLKSLQAGAESRILGIPAVLAAGTTLGALSPAYIGVLGFIENRFFFGINDLLKRFVVVHIPIPLPPALSAGLITAVLFGLFHVTAFGLSMAVIMFAIIVMGIWLIIASTPVGEEPTSLSHYLWNAFLALGKGLVIG